MRTSLQFHYVLAGLLCFVTASVLPGRAQSEFPRCHKDGIPPPGESQCECDPWIYRDALHDAKHGYDLRLPDKVVAFGPCHPGGAFHIFLSDPTNNEPDGGDFPWNNIWIGGVELDRETTLQTIAKRFAEEERQDSERDHAIDLKIDEPVQTSLSSSPAIYLKATRTDLDHGKIIYETIVAQNLEKTKLYTIGMVSPEERYEKNHALFQAVIRGFTPSPPEVAERR